MTDKSAVQLRQWTREEYDRMIEAGVLTPEDHVELIEGEILTMTPQGSAHAAAVTLVADKLRELAGSGAHVRVQLPLGFGVASEPEPDVALVAGSARDYRDRHPATARLLVEIADTTLVHDRGTKGSLYARFGIPEYWIVNLLDQCLEVYAGAAPDDRARYGFSYRNLNRYAADDTCAPQTLPGARIAVADLLP